MSDEDIATTTLSKTDFLKIVNHNTTYYGGDQAWFERYTQAFGGCGPTAAANILAYMAMTNPALEKLYGYDIKNITKTDFAKFMEEVYQYVTPLEVPISNNWSDKKGSQVGIPSLGITGLSDFAKGVEKFAQSKGIRLKANWSNKKTTFEFHEDEKVWDIKDQYLYGPDILVAPILYEGTLNRKVYLPGGAVWTNAHTGKLFEGSQSITVEAPMDVIPVFLRDGKQEYLIGKI